MGRVSYTVPVIVMKYVSLNEVIYLVKHINDKFQIYPSPEGEG